MQRAGGGGQERDSLWMPLSCPQPVGTRPDASPHHEAHCGDQQVLREPSCAISLAEGSTMIHSSSVTKGNSLEGPAGLPGLLPDRSDLLHQVHPRPSR